MIKSRRKCVRTSGKIVKITDKLIGSTFKGTFILVLPFLLMSTEPKMDGFLKKIIFNQKKI